MRIMPKSMREDYDDFIINDLPQYKCSKTLLRITWIVGYIYGGVTGFITGLIEGLAIRKTSKD